VQKEQLRRFRITHPPKCLNAAGLDWEYIIGGQGPETLVLCVGGARTSGPAFRLVLALEEAYRVIVPTYPYANKMDQLVDGIRAFLDAEGIQQAHIWGSSLGGTVAQCFIRRYPERVKTMIAGDTFVPKGIHIPDQGPPEAITDK
jgi:pimeloyl-ACP methyl ester carboxylesterase